MKILITGSAGFIGFHLAKKLHSQGEDLILIDNFARGIKDQEFLDFLKKPNIKFYDIDITKESAFSLIKEEIEQVYHLAAINGTKNFYSIPDKVLRVNVIGTLNLLDWIKNKPNVKILFSSSSEVYAGALSMGIGTIPSDEKIPICIDDITNPRWSYGLSKALSEGSFFSYSKRYSMNFSIIRYHNIYGPRMGYDHVIPQFFDRICEGEVPLKVYGAIQTRAFCYIDDAVDATIMVMNSEKIDRRIVHIGNDLEEVKINKLAKMMLRLLSDSNKIIELEPPLGSVGRRCPNIELLKSLGYLPKIMLQEGLIKTVEWYSKNKLK